MEGKIREEPCTTLDRATNSEEPCTAPDRISNLLGEIIDNILVKLPIKDAARTSVLSRKWRYKWHSMSKLVFGRKSLQSRNSPAQHQDNWQKLARIVDHVLILHTGPIREFSLVAGLPGGADVDRWMIHLMRTGVSCLTLWFSHGRHRVSSHLFACEMLDRLILHRCELKTPVSFKGFPRLRSLKLCSVSFPDGGLGNLIANCPCLEQVVLIGAEGCGNLEIVAPSLVKFFFYGAFDQIGFKNTPCLASANIGLSHVRENHRYSPRENCCLDKVLGGLQRIKRLFLEEHFLQFLAEYCMTDSHVMKFESLSRIHLDMNFTSLGQTLAAFCLFRSSPCLQNLSIKAMSENSSNSAVMRFWDSEEPFDCAFDQLRSVEISGVVGARHELRFIKLILANSLILETFKVNINPARRVIDEAQIFKELLRFQRASVHAEIIYTD